MSDKVVKLPDNPANLHSLPTLHFNSTPSRYNKKTGFGNFSKTKPIYIQVQSQPEIEREAKKEKDLFPVYDSEEHVPKVYKAVEKYEPPCHTLACQKRTDDSSAHCITPKKKLLEGPISTPEISDHKNIQVEGSYYPVTKRTKFQKLSKVRVNES